MTALLQAVSPRSRGSDTPARAAPRDPATPRDQGFASTLDRARKSTEPGLPERSTGSAADSEVVREKPATPAAPAQSVDGADEPRDRPADEPIVEENAPTEAATIEPPVAGVMPAEIPQGPIVPDVQPSVSSMPVQPAVKPAGDAVDVEDVPAAAPSRATALEQATPPRPATIELPADLPSDGAADDPMSVESLARHTTRRGATPVVEPTKPEGSSPARPDPAIAPATTAVNAAAGSSGSSQQNDAGGHQHTGPNPPMPSVDTPTTSRPDSTAPATAPIPGPTPAPSSPASSPMPPSQVPMPTPEQRFAADNVDRIVGGVKTELLPKGGSMQLRLDPPQLGKLEVTVKLQDGVLTASFVTRNDEAARMLSQTLSQLKSSLEASGVQVDRLHVQHAPPGDRSGDSRNQDQHGRQQQQSAGEQQQWQQSEQQRREMLQRMWKRLGLAGDPLDVTA